MLRTTTLLIASLLILIPAQAQDCERETDRYSGDTTISCEGRDLTVLEQPSDAIQTGNVAVAALLNDQNVYLLITAASESWNFLRTEEAHFLADGTRYNARVVRSPSSEVVDGGVVEQVLVFIPERDAAKMADASSIEVKLSTAVFDVSAVAPDLREALQLR